MNRIRQCFDRLKSEGRKGFVGYLTAGDPDRDSCLKNIREAIENGVDILELGVPFSDPTADGPTIQAASRRALASGMNLAGTIEMAREIRRDFDLPIILFGYVNPLFHYGYRKVCSVAAEAGVDGMLVVDLPFEESPELRDHMAEHGLCLIPLIAPTTQEKRVELVLREAEGFVYYIMVTGVTGSRSGLAEGIGEHIEGIRRYTSLPVVVGFGISSGEQAADAAQGADGAVVGSALIKAAMEGRLASLVSEIRNGLDGC